MTLSGMGGCHCIDAWESAAIGRRVPSFSTGFSIRSATNSTAAGSILFLFFFLGSGSSVVARFLFVFHVVELIAVPFGRQSEKKNSVKTRYKDVVVVVLMKQERLVPFLELFFCCCCCLSTERLHFYGHQHRTRRTRRDFDNVPFVCVMLLLFFFRFFCLIFSFFVFHFFFGCWPALVFSRNWMRASAVAAGYSFGAF